MESKKQASSSSSFTNELFGSKESYASDSSGFFNSIFPPVSKAHRKDYISSEETEKNYDSATGRGPPVDYKYDDGNRNPKTNMNMSTPYYQQQTWQQPCHLSSSIFYGGQDVYTNPRITKNTPGKPTYKLDGEDEGHASRGNWWKGSLYY